VSLWSTGLVVRESAPARSDGLPLEGPPGLEAVGQPGLLTGTAAIRR